MIKTKPLRGLCYFWEFMTNIKLFFLEEKLSSKLGAVDFVRAEFAIFD